MTSETTRMGQARGIGSEGHEQHGRDEMTESITDGVDGYVSILQEALRLAANHMESLINNERVTGADANALDARVREARAAIMGESR